MKILIVALPRTGSSELLWRISNYLGLKYVYEPFDKSGRWEYNNDEDDIAVKSLIFDKTDEYDNYIDFYVDLAKSFDKVILLTRKDLRACAESWAYYRHIKDSTGEMTMHKYEWKETSNLIQMHRNIVDWNSDLIRLSRILNIRLTYYEDIFDVNSGERYRSNL